MVYLCASCTVWDQPPSKYTNANFEGALDIMGLERPKQKDIALPFLITIFTTEQRNVK